MHCQFLGMSEVGLYLALANDKTVLPWIEEDLSKSTGYSGRLRIGDPEIDNLTTREINLWIGAHKWLDQKRPVLKTIICDEWEYCSRQSEYGDDYERLITDMAQQIKDVVGVHLASLVATVLFKESLISFCMCENIQRLMREAVDAFNQKQHDDHTFELFARITQADPNNHLAHHFQGYIRSRQGCYEAATLHYRKALMLNPTEPTYWNALGCAYAHTKGDLETAQSCAMLAVAMIEDENLHNKGACLDSLGWVLCQKGEYAQALKYLSEAWTLIENWRLETLNFDVGLRQEVLYHIAEAYRGLEDQINLHKTINQILRLDPKSIWAKKVESLRTPKIAMADSEFAAAISIDFFFQLMETCDELHKQDPSMTLHQRMHKALEFPPLASQLDNIYARLSDKDLFKDGLDWLFNVLRYCSTDEAHEVLGRSKMAQLHYLHYTDAGAAWRNLQVCRARYHLLSELNEILLLHFPHWERDQVSDKLNTIPLFVLLEDEFTPLEEHVRSILSIDFVIAFLKSAYILHLGVDPVPDEFPQKGAQLISSKTKGLGDLLRSNRPRYVTVSHADFFQRIKAQPPFSKVYTETLSKLRTITDGEIALEDVLLSLTFKLSLPYAHSIINSREFIESMGRTGLFERLVGSLYQVMSWILGYVTDFYSDGCLERFQNPANLQILDIAACVPLVAELFSVLVDGSYDRELYTCLDDVGPAPDEEFDDIGEYRAARQTLAMTNLDSPKLVAPEIGEYPAVRKMMARLYQEIRGPYEILHSGPRRAIKILFLAANPSDTPRLRLDEELQSIDQALRQPEFRNRFEIEQHWAVRMTDLQGYLLHHRPDIVHFSGHGSTSSEIILQHKSGMSYPVSTQALSSLFSVLNDTVRCVVLNAGYSEKQARAIAEHINCVIGMSKAISDSSAISFMRAFYQALGYGRDVKTAFDIGCNQIELENPGEQHIPTLFALKNKSKETVFAKLAVL